jgi:heptaprenyl diphosphate synthase
MKLSRMDPRAAVPVLAAFAVAVHVIETVIPSPVPFFRPGLANVVSLIGIAYLGLVPGLYITWIRVIVGSLFTGGFLGPSFLLSLSGGTAAALVMGICVLHGKNRIGPIGICMAGAASHLTAQFLVAYPLFLGNGVFLYLVPVLFLCALVSGLLTGVVSLLLMGKMGDAGLLRPAGVPG